MATVALVVSATLTAAVATLAASVAFLAISLMLAPISSAPVATVCRFWLTCWVALETTLACAEVSSELAVICWLVLESSSLALATCMRMCRRWTWITWCRLFFMLLSAG